MGDADMEKKVTAIIPARAGSKGIPNKNIIDFCGKPLIAWSIEQALQSKYVGDVYVSTDGEDIAKTAQKYGAKIIWRPAELASDNASSESVILHAVTELQKEYEVSTILFLQATSPVRLSMDIDNAIALYFEKAYDSLFSMSVLEDYCIWKKTESKLESFTYDYRKRGRRQEREKLYLENGSIYIFSTKTLLEYDNRLGGNIGMYEMPFDRSFEIDSMDDVETCLYFMKKYYKEKL